jgi:hypothetical protein
MSDPPADDIIPAAIPVEAVVPEVVIPTFAPKEEPKPVAIPAPKILPVEPACDPVSSIKELAKAALDTHVSKK